MGGGWSLPSFAQSANAGITPCGTGIGNNEIAIEFANPSLTATLTVYDDTGTAIVPLSVFGAPYPSSGSPSVAISRRNPNGCDAFVNFPAANGGPSVIEYGNTTQFVTIEIAYGESQGESALAVYRLLYKQSSSPADGSFFRGYTIGSADFYMLIEQNRIRVSPDYWWRGAATSPQYQPDYVDDIIPDDGWVLPYHAAAYCAANGGCVNDMGDNELLNPFLMPVSQPFVHGQTLVKHLTPALSMVLPDVSPTQTTEYAWTESWLTLAFAPGTRLDVQSSGFNATGMTFTASNISQGWSGVRFLPGSGGGLFGTTPRAIVERVAGDCAAPFCVNGGAGASIHVEGTSAQPSAPVLNGVTVRLPATGAYVHGLRTTGVGAAPLATNLIVEGMTGSGVLALAGSKPELRGFDVNLSYNTESAVLASGTGTRAYLAPAPFGSSQRGPQIINGAGDAVTATASGRVTFTGPGGGLGFANLNGNTGRGLRASGGGAMDAGTFFSYSRNRIVDNAFGNSTGNGLASGAGTTVLARCNWWGTATPANFRIGAQSGASFDAATFLASDPYFNANVACTNGSGAGEGLTAGPGGTAAARSGSYARSATAPGTMSSFGVGDTPADRFASSFDLPPAEALATLVALVADVPEAPEAASALTAAGGLAQQADTPLAVVTGALALLNAQASGGPAALRQAAHQALAGVHASRGDAAAALASAGALVAMGDAAARAGYAAEVFVRSSAGDTGSALAALASLEAAWAGSDEALAAREHLAALGVEVPGGGRVAAPETAAPEATAATAEATKTGEAAETSLAVRPNPSAAGAPGVVTLVLAEAADVRVAVYDLLGREVAVALDGALAAGEHTATAGTLSPGVYLVRATAGGRVVATTRLTVVR